MPTFPGNGRQPRARTDAVVTATETACSKIREFRALQAEGSAIRLTVLPDAPLERRYELEFVPLEAEGPGDITHVQEDLVFFVDRDSANALWGTRIDYVEGMWTSGFSFTNPNTLAGPVARQILEAIETHVLPVIRQHGGSIELVDLQGSRAFVRFGGGCQGCGMIDVTFKDGVTRTIVEHVAGVESVTDVTDHSSGSNPYYSN